jgi:hypothetical protein
VHLGFPKGLKIICVKRKRALSVAGVSAALTERDLITLKRSGTDIQRNPRIFSVTESLFLVACKSESHSRQKLKTYVLARVSNSLLGHLLVPVFVTYHHTKSMSQVTKTRQFKIIWLQSSNHTAML